MTSFDYLQGPSAMVWRHLLFSVREMRSSLVATAFALCVLFAVNAIGARGLAVDLARESVYRERADGRTAAIVHARADYATLQKLAQFDRRVRAIWNSGDRSARVLAEIAGRLPGGAWLLSAGERDDDGLTLVGRTPDLRVIAAILNRFGDSKLGKPELISTSAQEERANPGALGFEIHVLPKVAR